MTKVTWEQFWQELVAEVEARGPQAVVEFKAQGDRYRLGADISILRRRAGITQAKLAELSGIDQSDLSRIERGAGNPTYETLCRIAQHVAARVVLLTLPLPRDSSKLARRLPTQTRSAKSSAARKAHKT